MADKAERHANLEAGIYDASRDANWQARLEEARAKREIALRNKAASSRPKKRLKPWEEEGAIVPDDDADFSPKASGLEFFDRVDAMQGREAPETAEARPVLTPVPEVAEPEPTRAGANWSPEAEQRSLTPKLVPVPEATPAPEPSVEAPQPKGRVGSVNDIFSDPVFDQPIEQPEPKEDDDETIPIELLRVPPPEPVRPRPTYQPEPKAAPEPVVAAATKDVSEEPKKKKRSGVWAMAVLFIGAIAIGPIYKYTQPIERGPLVFTLSSFPIEPAFGLTSPMFEQPTPTRSREWQPASLRPTDEPLALAKPNVPQRARTLETFAEVPVFGPDVSGILVGQRLEALPETPVGATLPVILPERPLGPNAQAIGLGRDLGGLPTPAPRPALPANG